MKRYLVLFLLTFLVGCVGDPNAYYSLNDMHQGKYVGKNFSILVPAEEYFISENEREGFTSVDFVTNAQKEADKKLYSIEISENISFESNDQFHEYWNGFIQDYLTKNFGEYGRYDVIHSEANPNLLGHDIFLFIGTGNHNSKDLPVGSIMGISKYFNDKKVTFYVLLYKKIDQNIREIKASTDFAEFIEYYESFEESF